MLEKIVKKTGTTPSEQYLSAKADQIFSPLWPYSSLFRDDGCSANGTGKELVDLLLHFNGHIVLFSDKNIAFPADPNVDMAWRRWYKSSVVKSVEQLDGAKKCIQRKENGLFLDEKCQKPFPFDISTGNPVFHLVAVTHNSSEAARKYFKSREGESDGSLKCRLHMDVDDAASHPFTVPGFDRSKTFVHVFDEATLDLVLDELSTATDFIHYLSEKERAVRSGNLTIAMDEKDILASYLIKRSLNDFRMLESETYIDAEDDKKRGLWNKYVTSEERKVWKVMQRDSVPWNDLIGRLSRNLLDANIGEGHHHGIVPHEMTLRYLASENLPSRSYLANFMVHEFLKIPSEETIHEMVALITASPMNKRRAYAFVFCSTREYGRDHEDYRKRRNELMHACFLAIMHCRPNFDEIVTVGLDQEKGVGQSETIIVFDDLVDGLSVSESDQALTLLEKGIMRMMWFHLPSSNT